jgi:hypothetical protein
MFICCTKRSSVINLIYSGQQHFSYKMPKEKIAKCEISPNLVTLPPSNVLAHFSNLIRLKKCQLFYAQTIAAFLTLDIMPCQ